MASGPGMVLTPFFLPFNSYLFKIKEMKRSKVEALILFSGGLDSMLAVKVLAEQGIKIEIINFYTMFFGPDQARQSAKELGLPLQEIDMSEDFLALLRHPRHGFGAGLNPCIDCHALMLKKAGEIMRAEKFDLVATGEVLGERPMSQNKQALAIVEKDSGLAGYLLRPLSAKLLEPTLAEQQGLVDRNKLLDISGRRREKQIVLAKQYGIKKYPSPGGGCALTQEGFAGRLKELMKYKPDFGVDDARLVGVGRHFWLTLRQAQGILPERSEAELKAVIQIVLGRDQEENEFLKSQTKTDDVFIIPINFPGPEALIRGQNISEKSIERAKDLIVEFAPKAKELDKSELTFSIKSSKN